MSRAHFGWWFFGAIWALSTLIGWGGCGVSTPTYSPVAGDLIFQDADCGPFCEAIEKVTQSLRGARFSHVGIVQQREGQWVVIEANNGVEITPLDTFLRRSVDAQERPKAMAARLKPEYGAMLPAALRHAESLVGKPYDEWFNIANDSLYCSELLYFAFREANGGQPFFPLSPMTFHDPATGSVFPVWQSYFDQRKASVPEGFPGLNPGGISRDARIEPVCWFYEPGAGGR
jgi:hypothetical protein